MVQVKPYRTVNIGNVKLTFYHKSGYDIEVAWQYKNEPLPVFARIRPRACNSPGNWWLFRVADLMFGDWWCFQKELGGPSSSNVCSIGRRKQCSPSCGWDAVSGDVCYSFMLLLLLHSGSLVLTVTVLVKKGEDKNGFPILCLQWNSCQN